MYGGGKRMTQRERQIQTLQELVESKKMMAELYPEMAHSFSEPDVNVLLKTFAFLIEQLGVSGDDNAPEFTHSILAAGWPHQLRPIPASSVLQFTSLKGRLSGKGVIPRGTVVASCPVEGTPCQFKTCFE